MLLLKKSAAYFRHFIELVYPNLCRACGNHLSESEEVLCIICENELPKTGFHAFPDNAVFKRMYNRMPVENATSLFYFDKGNRVQRLMHQLKYSGKTEIGEYLGMMLGNDLKNTESYKSISLIVPVPLHEKKIRQRGYNQSEYFAYGIAKAMKTPVVTNIIKRTAHTETQTGKNRFERWDNVKEAFRLISPELITDNHILLVDDVITTGATLEACGQLLTEIRGVRLSIATIAFAH
jgi:ComF family protein